MPLWNRASGHASTQPQGRVPFAKRVYPYNLRWVLFFTSLIGIIWAVAMGVQQFQNRTSDSRPTKLQVFDIVTGILYMVIALLELYVLIVASLHNARLGKLLMIVAPAGVAVAVGTQILMVIIHFALKGDKISQCVTNYTTMPSIIVDGKASTATQDQASQWCDEAYDRGTWSVFAWLVMVILVALFFASMTMQYARQLADPSLVRSRFGQQNQNQNGQQAYPLQPQGGFYPPPPLQHHDSNSWPAPPYSGPPPPFPSEQGPGGGYDKSNYHPRADWATSTELEDEDPFRRSPGTSAPRRVDSDDPEERAWQEARANGVTAHLTGQASPPGSGTGRVRDEENSRGFVVPNQEEEEAWERARNEGVTAHLTGGGAGMGMGKGDGRL